MVDVIIKIKKGKVISFDCDHKRSRHLNIPIGPFSDKTKGSFGMPQSVTITTDQKFSLGPVTATDANGNKVPLGGPVSMTSSDPTLLTVADNGDGTWEATAVGPAGSDIINVTDTVITDTVDVTITQAVGPETALVIPLGAPQPK